MGRFRHLLVEGLFVEVDGRFSMVVIGKDCPHKDENKEDALHYARDGSLSISQIRRRCDPTAE